MTRLLCVFAVISAVAAIPGPETLNGEKAPDVFTAEFDVGQPSGKVLVEVHRDWAPHGADRFHALVKNGFYDNCRVFRNVEGFVAQFGINGDPDVQNVWRDGPANIPDDPVKQSNKRGYLVFATAGPNTRTTQVFINLAHNRFLDNQGFAPIGRVVKGMDVVDKFYGGYGEKPDQTAIQTQGNKYLNSEFPQLTYFKSTKVKSGSFAGDVVPEADFQEVHATIDEEASSSDEADEESYEADDLY